MKFWARGSGHGLGLLFSVWGAVTIVFVATRMIGDPAALLLPVGAGPEALAQLRAELGLDQPLGVQYLRYLFTSLRGDFGLSFHQGQPAMGIVLERLPATFALAAAALGIGLVFGVAMGLAGALSANRTVRTAVAGVTALGQALPAFWLALMLIMVFAVQLRWLPTGGAAGPLSLVLPAFTLAAPIAASIARLLRASLLETLEEDFVRTAHAKGLPSRTVFLRHVLPNSFAPVLSLSGLIAGELLGGSVIVETVFAWPGLGRLLIQSIAARDFPVIQAATLLIAVMYVAANLLVDLLQTRLDPRLRKATT